MLLGAGLYMGVEAGELGGPVPRPGCSPGRPRNRPSPPLRPRFHRTFHCRTHPLGVVPEAEDALPHQKHRQLGTCRTPDNPIPIPLLHHRPRPCIDLPASTACAHAPPPPDVRISAREVPVRGRPSPCIPPSCTPSSVTLSSCHTIPAPRILEAAPSSPRAYSRGCCGS